MKQNKEKPFFVYLPHTMIHGPMAASEAFKGKSASGLLGDVIEEIDWSVGQVMKTIKELGLDEKTLVIFTSDNGPATGSAGPFRGKKGSNFEGGVREPCIMRWPGKIPAGTQCSQIAGNIDVLPTLASIAGADKKWKFANARLEGETVIVSSPDVNAPLMVRFAWADNPIATLFNGAGIPAAPFRTDK